MVLTSFNTENTEIKFYVLLGDLCVSVYSVLKAFS